MKTTKEKAEIMLAFDRGEKVEATPVVGTRIWRNNPLPLWDWAHYDYCIAEKPKEKEKIKMLCYIRSECLTWCIDPYNLPKDWKRFPAGDIEGEVGE